MENRVCKLCENRGQIVIEDEFHFLLKCEMYKDLRKCYSHLIFDNACFEDFINIMKSEDEEVIRGTASFLYHAFLYRSNLLNDS